MKIITVAMSRNENKLDRYLSSIFEARVEEKKNCKVALLTENALWSNSCQWSKAIFRDFCLTFASEPRAIRIYKTKL